MSRQMSFVVESTISQRRRDAERFANAKPNSIAVKRPDLLEEWDWEKNDELGLDPYQLTTGSNKLAWWKCVNHADGFDMTINHRCRPRAQCPYCSGRRIVVGVNDLASQYPEIAAEWDYEKNCGVEPSEVFKCSSKKFWWVCQKHGSYMRPVSARTSGGTGCAKCGRERTRIARIMPKEGESLADKYPNLAAEWHPVENGDLTPYDVKPGSGKKVTWLHAGNHKWSATISSRVSGRGCPYCSGKAVLTGFNDLATVAPDVASEWHPKLNGSTTPEAILATSNKKYWWLGSCNHEWEASPKNRVGNHTGCPYCYKDRRVSFSEKAIFFYIKMLFDDAEQNANLNALSSSKQELDIWIPSKRIAIEYDGYYWHNMNPERDAKKDAACQNAGIRLIRVREKLCREYDGCTAEIIKRGAVDGNDSLERVIKDVLVAVDGNDADRIDVDVERDNLAITELVKTNFIERSLVETHLEIASEWNYELNGNLTPEMFTYGSHRKVWWNCPKGHEPYHTEIATRSHGSGCPKCKGDSIRIHKLKPKPGCSLAERYPNLAKEWHPTKNGDLKPSDVSYGSRSYSIWWTCPKGHNDYQALPNSRTSRGTGCPICASEMRASSLRRPKKGHSLAETCPNVAAEWHPTKNGNLTPKDVARFSGRKVWWQCPNNPRHEYLAAIGNRTGNGSGCPFCYKESWHKKTGSH